MQGEQQSWRPIETAPKDGQEVLVYDGKFYWLARWIDVVNEWDTGTSDSYGDTVYGEGFTHWMPLPSPPEPTP